ncbi:ATP-grasp domain-containing protein [Geopseudomonas aromaticivorans]
MIWFLQGQSSQRDVIEGARKALPAHIKIYASHTQDRPEITGMADVAWREPEDADERVEWVLAQAKAHGIKVILAGRKTAIYEARRADFEAAGIDLITGVRSMDDYRLDDKSVFTAECQRAGLRVVPAITATDGEELFRAVGQLLERGPVCVKPVRGIYGAGFWRLEVGLDPFRCFAFPDDRKVDAATFIDLYRASANPQPQLVMPYMPGEEVSVDIVCERGEPVAWVGRRKHSLTQSFERDGAAVELALATVRHFGLDGIISVQTKDDADGVPHLLEVNLRYSGGIAYTPLAGVNLAGIFACRRLGLPEPVTAWQDGTEIKIISAAVPATSPENG